jgi:hypothetical protein
MNSTIAASVSKTPRSTRQIHRKTIIAIDEAIGS